MPKVVYISHGHPDILKGGAEILAYELFTGMRESAAWTPFLLCAVTPDRKEPHPGTPFSAINNDPSQTLIAAAGFRPFLQSQNDLNVLNLHLARFFTELQPDVVHFHHSVFIGVEVLRLVRNLFPRAPIVYTLHEYIPMCFLDGQMVRVHDRSVCPAATPTRCHQCFPDIPAADFRMRELFIKSHFDLVDRFLAPSHFLRGRYLQWGIPEHRILYQEHGRHLRPSVPPRPLQPGAPRDHFAFFGQINPYKGILILLQAMRILERRQVRDIQLSIHGANLERQSPDFQQQVRDLLAACPNVTMRGPYEPGDLPRHMQNADWTIIPSNWGENAPLVIQESFMHGRPMLASNISGMAEKVHDGIDGLHFQAGDPQDLADKMLFAVRTPGLWEKLRQGISPVYSSADSVAAHSALYQQLIEERAAL